MEITKRLIGVSAVVSPQGQVVDVDVEALIRRLILFDTYILQSIRLQEFPFLARRLGYERLRDLLSANLIGIRCECLQLIQTAQSGIFGDPVLPNFRYQFHWLDFHDREKYVHDGLQELHNLSNVAHKDILRLKRQIIAAIDPLPKEIRPELFPVFKSDILHNSRLLEKAVRIAAKKMLMQEPPSFSLKIHQESDDIFRAETDLAQRLSVDEAQAHKLVELGLLGVAHLTQSIGEMKAYSALNGFRDEELPLFRDKLDSLAEAASSQSKELNFQRVIEIADLPIFVGASEIDIERLIKVRDLPETREFRDWLVNIGAVPDREIRERIASMQALVGLKIDSTTGQVIRFLTLSAVSCISHINPLITSTLGVLDQFVINRLFPRSGVAAFVNELYPSIFDRAKTIPNSHTIECATK